MNRLFLLLLAAVLTACSSVDPRQVPTPLESIDNPVKLRIKWENVFGVGTQGLRLHLVPAVDDANIYVAERSGQVGAFLRATGSAVWRVQLAKRISSGIGMVGHRLLIGGEDSLIVLDAGSGAVLWETVVSSEILSRPVAANNVVVVHTVDGQIIGLDLQSGSRLWSSEYSVPPLTVRGISTPVLANGMAVVGLPDGRLIALDAATGVVRWPRQISQPRGRHEIERLVDVDVEPVVVGGKVIAGSFQGQLVSMTLVTGEPQWNRELSLHTGLAVAGDAVFAVDEESTVWAFHVGTGASLWKQEKLKYRRLSPPVIWGDALAVVDLEGYLHLLDPADGRLLGRIRVGEDPAFGGPVAAGVNLFVQDSDGKITSVIRAADDR